MFYIYGLFFDTISFLFKLGKSTRNAVITFFSNSITFQNLTTVYATLTATALTLIGGSVIVQAAGPTTKFTIAPTGVTSEIDITFTGATVGPVLKDDTDGHTYRLTTHNGALTIVQVS